MFRLPARAYHEPAWLEREMTLLFDRTWALVGASSELAGPGSVLHATVGVSPLELVRGEDGSLTARSGGGHAASVYEWEGMVFAHPDPHAPPLVDFLGPFVSNIGSFRPGLLVEIARADIEGSFNWKLFVENHVDVLHLWYLHNQTLAGFDHARFVHHNIGGHWVSYEPRHSGRATSTPFGEPAPAITHLDARDRDGIGAHLIFPNILMASAAEFFITYAVIPLGPDRSRVELRARAEPGADPAALVAAARSFIDEDITACEAIQAVVRSSRFEVGPLATDHEAPIMNFHDHLLAALGDLP